MLIMSLASQQGSTPITGMESKTATHDGKPVCRETHADTIPKLRKDFEQRKVTMLTEHMSAVVCGCLS